MSSIVFWSANGDFLRFRFSNTSLVFCDTVLEIHHFRRRILQLMTSSGDDLNKSGEILLNIKVDSVTRNVALTPGILTSLPGRYAKALFDLAQEKHQVQRVASALRTLKKLFQTSKILNQVLANPTISREEQEAALIEICAQMEASEIFQSFAGELVRARRIPYLFQIEAIYQSLVSREKKEQVIEVISAYPLTTSQRSLLKGKLKKVFPELISLEFINDPKVLGGIMVRIGSRIIDATLATHLNKLATVMKGTA